MHVFSLCMTDFRWNSIGVLGARALLSSLKHNSTVLHIHLDGNNIPVDILDAFGMVLALFHNKIGGNYVLVLCAVLHKITEIGKRRQVEHRTSQ